MVCFFIILIYYIKCLVLFLVRSKKTEILSLPKQPSHQKGSENDNSEVSAPVGTGQKRPPHKKSKDTGRDKHSGSSATQWISDATL